MGVLDYFFEIYDQEYCKKISTGVYMKSLIALEFPLQKTLYVDVIQTI